MICLVEISSVSLYKLTNRDIDFIIFKSFALRMYECHLLSLYELHPEFRYSCKKRGEGMSDSIMQDVF